MKKQTLRISFCLMTIFSLWTAAVLLVDVQPIGPEGSQVGFAAFNGFVHSLTGVNWKLYVVTDWLSLVPIFLVLGFGLLGLFQWIRRKHIRKVDRSILVLGGFYAAVFGLYLFFECFAVNYRPVLIDGRLEASYPSSTTLLVLCVMPTAMMQLWNRIRSCWLRKGVMVGMAAFMVFMVVGRILSGVHWMTDIIGGALLSAGLVMLYRATEKPIEKTI